MNLQLACSQVVKITIGSNRGGLQTKCVDKAGMACASNAGNRGIRINGDYKDASDAFTIYTSAWQVCAKRVSRKDWGMNLQLACTFKN